ncbi:MAG: hypothetical protein A2508_04035 [Candidatus Lambdaproteobacteria bacterium RIFOXYD12_FULL_49_8]|uniref:HTH tetR-type domain-containing protein n=1 Tax=Candidatus Lambdaproteobacteria bacterium RIFOXYD2_FULL_50_16 TaxID=1817772 RepID=A0A1F6G6J9_9PROT|nr:MAG: hypothetical protein A2527_11520 [Candidatus Lambdaproteobacteria bacterium RIFOXYD2_FULL_50_16]OGG97127.1 MAG: hypothetical protein A2508_04035 [Candidatus Lambdaproteobacteria bacterium RIFOXYD12_FULL_49_8]
MGKAERTRQYIIEKAAPLFNRKGYAGTSMSDLTQALGMTKGAIYGNFKDKDEVAIEAFKFNLAFINRSFESEQSQSPTGTAKLMSYARAYRKIYKEVLLNGGCPILNTAAEADDTHPKLHHLARQAIIQWKRRLVSLVEAGKAEGALDADTDAHRFAETVIALFEGGGVMAKVTGQESYMESALTEIEELIEAIEA